MILRRFNEKGIELFWSILETFTTDARQELPSNMLYDDQLTELIEPEVEIEEREFSNRFEAAEYLFNTLSSTGILDIEKDRGLWAWLSLLYFEQLCPPDQNGNRRPGERARWIPVVSDYRRYYRHLLAGLYRIRKAYKDNPERAMVLLCTPLDKPGDFPEQLASRQELVTNPSVIEAATRLFVDEKTHGPKRGSRGKGPGSVRRFAMILNQFDLTWDLYSLSVEELLSMLPVEFNRFR